MTKKTSDNIYYSNPLYFLNCDTLYLGLETDFQTLNSFLKKIKNYLFFLENEEINSSFCRNRFYGCEISNKDYGFFIFFEPRKGCRNDFCTIQLMGTFFRYRDLAREFIEDLFVEFGDYIRFQRVDVCLDVIYTEKYLEKFYKSSFDYGVPEIVSHFPTGFPIMSYSEEWKNRKVCFEYFGRSNDGFSYAFNMQAQGKNDFRIRVYDKTLDLVEKYSLDYFTYYFLKKPFDDMYSCFRIEAQIRGDKLKHFVSLCNASVNPVSDYDSLCVSILNYIFYKYDFYHVDKNDVLGFDWFLSNLNHKRESSVIGRLAYNRKMQYSYYKKVLDCQKELEHSEISKNKLKKINKNLSLKKNIFEIPFQQIIQTNFDEFLKK